MIWSQQLSDAAKAVRDDPAPHPYWPESDADVRSRAREFADHPVGSTLKLFQEEYLECFVQRLDYTVGGPHQPRASHLAFREALTNAKKGS